jgi:hypothetical protein
MNYGVTSIVVVVMTFSEGCASGPAPLSAPVATATAGADWLAHQPVVCGEVRGRVLDARTGTPLADAYVTADSASRGVSTDSLGHFRLVISPLVPNSPTLTRATTLRIRRIGTLELRVYLPPNLGYAVEASLASMEQHVDHVSALRIKTPGFCERAA